MKLMGAFVEALSADGGYAVLRQRGGAPGYVHVVLGGLHPGRARNRHVAIERRNGTVAVTEQISGRLRAHERPNERIEDNPIGYSAGPNYGRFRWALSYSEIVDRWGGELAFAREVTGLLRGLEDVDGDYL